MLIFVSRKEPKPGEGQIRQSIGVEAGCDKPLAKVQPRIRYYQGRKKDADIDIRVEAELALKQGLVDRQK